MMRDQRQLLEDAKKAFDHGFDEGHYCGWNEAIQTAIHQAKHICPDAKDLHDALEACLIKEE